MFTPDIRPPGFSDTFHMEQHASKYLRDAGTTLGVPVSFQNVVCPKLWYLVLIHDLHSFTEGFFMYSSCTLGPLPLVWDFEGLHILEKSSLFTPSAPQRYLQKSCMACSISQGVTIYETE